MGWTAWGCSGSHALVRALLPARSQSGSGGPQEAGRADGRTRGGDRALEQGRGGGPETPPNSGRERSLSPRGQDRGRWVGALSSARGATEARVPEEEEVARKLQAKHLSKGPRKQSLLELGGLFLSGKEKGCFRDWENQTATSDCLPQNIIKKKTFTSSHLPPAPETGLFNRRRG